MNRISTVIAVLFLTACTHNTEKKKNTTKQEPVVKFIAAGDIMLTRGTARAMKKLGRNYPFLKIAPFIKSFDIAFCNLESIISNKGHPIAKPITFEADTQMIIALKNSGFDVINLANNHALDYGRYALKDCIKRLKKAKLYTVGAGNTLKDAYKPLIINRNTIKIAFIGYCSIPTGVPVKQKVPQIAVFNLDTAVHTINRIRDTVDFIIVSLHWGIEYKHHPTKQQIKIAHKLIDAGADIILGHHPHVIQEIEFYKNKPIIYSMGNFIFDQRGAERNEGILFACTFTKDSIENVTVFPIGIIKSQPHLLNAYESVKFVRKYKNILRLK